MSNVNSVISPELLSKVMGQKFPPTPQQADVIGAEIGPRLIVAGAGAGKTETMANRVVWLVANRLVDPNAVLGLTFTRKAAQQLSQRIRARLATFAGTPKVWDIDPSGEFAKQLENINPTVSTYDSYAGRLVSEYGLLLPVEPSARLIGQTELFQIAWEIVQNYSGTLSATQSQKTVVDTLLKLSGDMDSHMVTAEEIREESIPFINLFDELPRAPRQKEQLSATMQKYRDLQRLRLEYLDLVALLKEELKDRNVITFGEQMSMAARLASTHPEVGERERNKFRVVMLDEYQDTSHSQRVLLRSLFGGSSTGLTVNAVGDPMQSIYGWRGATSANLQRFVEDFPTFAANGESSNAPKSELTISWRNPADVLVHANAVSRTLLGSELDPKRPVQPLSPNPASGAGEIELAWFPTTAEEVPWVADKIADEFTKRTAGEGEFTGAVLVRKRKQIGPIAKELTDRGIPVEVVGLAGLLSIPEIQDMIAIATMLIRPQDNGAALRILTGPLMNLGVKDIEGLMRRARNLAGRVVHYSDNKLPSDPTERLKAIIAETLPADDEAQVGLTDAVSDLGEPTFYSEVGYARLRQLSAMLRHLRVNSLSRSLSDLFIDIEQTLGLRAEVLTRQDPNQDGVPGTIHLDRFAEEVAAFSQIQGASLSSLLDYFDLADDEEDGLDPGEVQVRSNRVQIMTVHKSKGLEWDVVSVLNCDNGTWRDEKSKSARTDTWINKVEKIPSTLRGDARWDQDTVGTPVLDASGAENRKELENEIGEHKKDFGLVEIEETTRLFYVAITRTAEKLFVTGSSLNNGTTERAPYAGLELMKATRPQDVVEWFEGDLKELEANKAPEEGVFPVDHLGGRRQAAESAADLVRQALVTLPTPQPDGETETLWEQEVSALIEEHQKLNTTEVNVEIGEELTASDLVAIRQSPENFAKRKLRPVPFKPNMYAKRGTAFHEWLENRFGMTSLLDEDELPGIGEEDPRGAQLQSLKDAFEKSEWGSRTPAFVEQPFEFIVGSHVVKGRMDAVFHFPQDQHEWMVVDWKTGQPPKGEDLKAAQIQLAVYRIAWAQLLSKKTGKRVDPDEIRAAFHYISSGFTLEPSKLPSAEELAEMLNM